MNQAEASWEAQRKGWNLLRTIRPAAVDLSRISLLRESGIEDLSSSGYVESLLPRLGLNDEGLEEFPDHLHAYCGEGLRLWQYPNQFSKYLAHLSKLRVTSYLELGVRHGGSFVVTAEYLSRFTPLEKCLGIDIIACPSMADYERINRQAQFNCCNTQAAGFDQFIEQHGPFDLAFIDSHHEEMQCRREFMSVKDSCRMIGLHDIFNTGCPGVAVVWREIKKDKDYACIEFIEQYDNRGPYMGIGLAIKHSL